MDTITKHESGKSLREIAKLFSVGHTQIGSIISQKQEIINLYSSGIVSVDRKILKPVRLQYPEINERVWKWFCNARSKNIPVSAPVLEIMSKTLIIYWQRQCQQVTSHS